MLGKDYNRIDREWPLAARRAKCATKQADVLHKDVRAPVRERDREEIDAARNEIAPIIDHDEILAC